MAYPKPTNALTFSVVGRQFAVFCTGTPVGTTIYLFENKADATGTVGWQYMADVGPRDYYSAQDLVNDVNAAGGPVGFIKTILASINAWLKTTFSSTVTPPVGYVPPKTTTIATVMDDLNAALGNAFESYTDATGMVQIRAKTGF